VLSLNAIFAADRMLVPVSSDYLSLRGALQIEHTLKALEPVLKRRIERRYLLTRFDRRRKMSFEIQERLRKQFGAELCETVISENVALAEAPAMNRDIFAHQPGSRGAQDYLELMRNCGRRAFSEAKARRSGRCSANDEVRDFLEADDREYANAAVMADAFDDLAVVIHLPQLALGIEFVAAVDHQVVHHHAEPRPDLECIFHEPVGMHKTPFTSMKFAEYMQ
jgi:hypothetical protein